MNRMISCIITDNEKNVLSKTNYAYDCLGRRIMVRDNDEFIMRSMYDGFYQVDYVLTDGNFSHYSADYSSGVVRPALWIDL